MSLIILFCSMQRLSVVIVCKNGAKIIGETIKSFSRLTDDILVYDNGSTDGTKEIVKKTNARLVEGNWEGFGKTKNKANVLAKYDWILSLDADEAIDEELKENLLKQDLADDKHTRLFNRVKIKWNDADVHESLLLPNDVKLISVPGYVLHKTAANFSEY